MDALSRLFRARWARLLFALLLASAVAFFFRDQLGFISDGIAALRSASLLWVLVAVLLCALSFVAMAEVMVELLRAGGVTVRRRSALALVLAANSWSNSLPGGPALSTVLQYKVQRAWGASVMVISWFVVLSGALSTLWLVILGLLAVALLGATFSIWSLVSTGIGVLVLVFFVYWAANNPHFLERCAGLALPFLNKMLRRSPDTGLEAAVGQIRQLQAVRLSFPRFVSISLMSLLNRLLDLASLWAAVVAVGGVASGPGVTLSFLSAKIVGATGITPGGLGPLEAALTASLTAAGLTASVALAAVLVYRMVSFILATMIGWVVYLVGLKEKP